MKTVRTNRSLRRTRRSAGFTLLEVLLVLAIIGVIAAFAVPQLLGRQQQAMSDATAVHIKNFENNVSLYAVANNGVYPSGDADTVVGMLMQPGVDKNGKQIQAYLTEQPRDAWGQPLMYEYPASGNRKSNANKPAIWSVGPDGQDGSDDDVVNWNVQL